eukprot:1159054-Pelagomonas_calceolata.AAC.15
MAGCNWKLGLPQVWLGVNGYWACRRLLIEATLSDMAECNWILGLLEAWCNWVLGLPEAWLGVTGYWACLRHSWV